MIRKFITPIAKKHPALMQTLRYIKRFHRIPDFKRPTDAYELSVHLSLDQQNQKRYASLADKFAVREFVKNTIGAQYLVPLLGHYNNADQIDFKTLPKSFVLKTTNGCATNILVKDKAEISEPEVREKLRNWMGLTFGVLSGEPHYSLIENSIIAEEMLQQDDPNFKGLTDYKFYCVDGIPRYVLICANRRHNGKTHVYDTMLYDMDWIEHPEYLKDKCNKISIPQPQSFELMKELAGRMAKEFKFVRVDFYHINGSPLFGEMTFTPGFDMENLSFLRHMAAQSSQCKNKGKIRHKKDSQPHT